MSPIEKNGKLNVYIVSDSLSDCKGLLSVSVLGFNGDTIFGEKQNITVKANASQVYYSRPIGELIGKNVRSELFVRVEFVPQSGGYTADNNYFLSIMKEKHMPAADIEWKSEKADGGYFVTLSSKIFARGVFLSINGIDNSFSDNYFDLLPNKPVKIFVRTNISQSDFDKQLKIVGFNVPMPFRLEKQSR